MTSRERDGTIVNGNEQSGELGNEEPTDVCTYVCAYVYTCTVEPLYCGHHCMGQENVSSLERCQSLMICTQEYTIGTSETVLIREVSLFQRLYTRVYYWDLRNCPD